LIPLEKALCPWKEALKVKMDRKNASRKSSLKPTAIEAKINDLESIEPTNAWAVVVNLALESTAC
jgi:hypothetical protein